MTTADRIVRPMEVPLFQAGMRRPVRVLRDGGWYGFPDFAGGKPVDQEWFKVLGGEVPKRVLQEPPGTPPQSVAAFGVHSSSNRFDFSRSPDFGHVGEAFVASSTSASCG